MTTNVHFDWIAPFYGRHVNPPDTKRLVELLDLPTTGWLLDAAGGTGRVAEALRPLAGHLVVCDLSLPMLQQIAVRHAAVRHTSVRQTATHPATYRQPAQRQTHVEQSTVWQPAKSPAQAAAEVTTAADVRASAVERLPVSSLGRMPGSLPGTLPGKLPGKLPGLLPAAQTKVERLPFADGQFERILVMDAFHHFADQPGSVRELARVLKPGGRLVIQEPNIRRGPVKAIQMFETLLLMGSHIRTAQAMGEMLSASGLQASTIEEDMMVWAIGIKA